MKRMLLLLCFLMPVLGFGQALDSLAAVKAVDSLIQISRTLSGKRDFDKALEVNAAAEKIAIEKLGRESATYGSCCFNKGWVNIIKGDYPEAETHFFEAKAIRERVLGKEHPDYAKSLNGLAILYDNIGKYEKAEPLYLEAKAIQEKVLSKEHPDYAKTLNNLAIMYMYMGNYEKAEPLHLEAKAVREKALGKEHPDYAISLNNLALLYRNMGIYEKAEPLFLEAKAIQEKVLGKEHSDYATSLNNLGRLYWAIGNYEKAEPLFLEAMAIREKILSKEHPDYAATLNSMADFYMSMGNNEKAEPLLLEAKAIREKALGKEHPDYAATLNSMAVFYMSMGNYEKAEPLLLEAKAIREKALGKENLYYPETLVYLANLYQNMGNYEKAEPLHLEAKAILEKVLGKENPGYEASLEYLALLYVAMGNYEKAEPLFLEAKAILEKTLGKEHPYYSLNLNDQAGLYEHQNRFSASEPLLAEASALEQTRLAKSASFLSERELANYTATFQWAGDNLGGYLLIRSRNNKTGTLPALAFGHALFQKGFLLNAAARLNTLAAASPESEEINLRLKGYSRRLAAQYAEPIAEQKGVTELEEKAAAAEKELARSVSGYAEAIRQVNWQEARAALKKGEAAIEFVHFKVNFPKKTDSVMYAALLLRPGDATPRFVPLFEEKQLAAILQSSSAPEKSALFTNLYAARGVQPIRTHNLANLYDLIWKPLEPLLASAEKIYFAPAGMLHQLNFNAIPSGDKKTLADRYELVELGSTRQLVVASQYQPAANDAVLFGGLVYDLADSGQAATDTSTQSPAPEFPVELASRSRANRGGQWDFLPGTEAEVAALGKQLNKKKFAVKTFRNAEGTEEAFKLLGKNGPSPRVLHLATHGFFFPDPKSRGEERGTRDDVSVFKTSDNPLIRSGLMLAGGNYAWKTGKPLRPGMDDGILTAYEISQMNLSGTELVVLSACETGLGDIRGNEGVYGLQRAFKIAGAHYLLMSLWQVPDRETAEFMTAFYQNWLEKKLPIPEAFRAAQRAMRGRFDNPYLWAGFVLVE